MGIAPRDLRDLTRRIAHGAAPAYLMAVSGNADPMLGYLTTAVRDPAPLRSCVGRRMTTAMEQRPRALDAFNDDGDGGADPTKASQLYAAYMKAGGEIRPATTPEQQGARRLAALRERSFDPGLTDPADADRRLEALTAQARAALYARIQDVAVREATAKCVRVRTAARDRDDYLTHPRAGEVLSDDAVCEVANLHDRRPPGIQIIVLRAGTVHCGYRSPTSNGIFAPRRLSSFKR